MKKIWISLMMVFVLISGCSQQASEGLSLENAKRILEDSGQNHHWIRDLEGTYGCDHEIQETSDLHNFLEEGEHIKQAKSSINDDLIALIVRSDQEKFEYIMLYDQEEHATIKVAEETYEEIQGLKWGKESGFFDFMAQNSTTELSLPPIVYSFSLYRYQVEDHHILLIAGDVTPRQVRLWLEL